MELTQCHLVMVPSPLDEQGVFDVSLNTLLKQWESEGVNLGLLVESEKIARRRWISSGFPKAYIENFVPYHEQNQDELNAQIIQGMKQNRRYLLISDEGIPTFFDPGQKLVEQMHREKLQVGCINFPCSVVHALVLSGFPAEQFWVSGFPPVKGPERNKALEQFFLHQSTSVLLDTAYRLKQVLQELTVLEEQQAKKQTYFLALDIGRPSHSYYHGSLMQLKKQLDLSLKRDFVLVKRCRK